MEEFDLKEFAQMFDAALASDNPGVKKALRNFMMITAIVHAQEEGERTMGPIETLVKKVSDLERMVYELQNTRVTKDYKDYYNNQTWVTTGTGYPYIPNTSTTSSTYYGKDVNTVWTDEVSEITDLLKALKFK